MCGGRRDTLQASATAQNSELAASGEDDECQRQEIAAEALRQLSCLRSNLQVSTAARQGFDIEGSRHPSPMGEPARVMSENDQAAGLVAQQTVAGVKNEMKEGGRCLDGNQDGNWSPTETSYSPLSKHCRNWEAMEVPCNPASGVISSRVGECLLGQCSEVDF